MKKILLLLIILVVFCLTGIGVFAMANVKDIPQPTAYVSSVEGKAFIMESGSEKWAELKREQEISAGDTIKTESDGTAMVNLFDNSSSRIGPDSEIAFDELYIDSENYGQTKVGISVQVGKVWSRIIQLMDKDSSFTVGSDSTVATVRGTIFNFELSKDGVAKVDNVENLVEVAAVKTKEELDPETGKKVKVRETIRKVNLEQGMSSQLDEKSNFDELEKIKIQKTGASIQESDWFQGNIRADEEFEKELRAKQERMNKEIAGILPDSPLYKFKKAGEKVRIMFTQDEEEKNKLEASFARQRLAESFELAQRGDNEKAREVLIEFQKMIEKLKSKPEINQLENQLIMQRMMLKEIMPGDQEFEFKTKIEDMQLNLKSKPENEEFLISKTIEERLEEARRLKESGDIDAFNKYMEDIKRELEQKNFVDPVLLERLKIIQEAIVNEESSEESGELDSGELVKDDSIEEKDAAIEYDKTILEPKKIDEPIIEEEVVKEEKSVEESIVIDEPEEDLPTQTEPESTVGPAPEIIVEKKLDTLEVICDRYNMQAGQSTQCRAIVNYTDGSTRDVGSESRWSISGDIGTISAGGLVSSDDDGGKGVVSVTFSEDGKTLSATSRSITALNISLF